MNKIHKKLFQDLSLEQLYQILKLRVDIFVVEQNCPYPELDGEDEQAVHLYMEEEGKVISYLRIMTNKSKTRIGRVITDKGHRGKRLSSKLMEEAIMFIKKQHSDKTVILSAQEHLQKFYGKFGFKPVSEMYMEDGIPHVDMEFQF